MLLCSLQDLVDSDLKEYIPIPWRDAMEIEDWADKVIAHRKEVMSEEPDTLQKVFVDAVKDHPLYGTHFFHVMKDEFPVWMDDFPERLILAFNSEGLHFLTLDRENLASFGYADIYRWGGSSTQFSIIIWNQEDQATDKVFMYTRQVRCMLRYVASPHLICALLPAAQAPDMAALILDYINAIMATTE